MDRETMRRVLVDARVGADDADAIIVDALRPIGRRELGRALHKKNYSDARARIVSALEYAMRLLSSEPDGDAGPTDPAGSGSSPTH